MTKNNSTKDLIYNTDIFAVQIGSNNNTNDAFEKAKEEGISFLNATECETELKSKDPSAKIIYGKVDWKPDNTTANTNQTTVSYSLYSSNNRTSPYNCTNDIHLLVPLPNDTAINYTLYTDLKNLGYDLYNKSDPFYNDICSPYTTDEGDYTLDDRRENIFQNMTLSCGNSCSYRGIADKGYLDCVCDANNGTNSAESGINGNEFLDALSQSNFMVVKCVSLVFRYVINLFKFLACNYV